MDCGQHTGFVAILQTLDDRFGEARNPRQHCARIHTVVGVIVRFLGLARISVASFGEDRSNTHK